jgi:hypothetical protein
MHLGAAMATVWHTWQVQIPQQDHCCSCAGQNSFVSPTATSLGSVTPQQQVRCKITCDRWAVRAALKSMGTGEMMEMLIGRRRAKALLAVYSETLPTENARSDPPSDKVVRTAATAAAALNRKALYHSRLYIWAVSHLNNKYAVK